MEKKVKEIRARYEDVVCGVTDYQMIQDIRALLRYVDGLHQRLIQEASQRAVAAALAALEGGPELLH